VITSLSGAAGVTEGEERPLPAAPLSGRDFAAVAMTESVVRLASLTHGVRRALSPENRNRIRFEMGREVKRSRRQRRRDVKEARRHLRGGATDRATDQTTDRATGGPPGVAEDAA